MTTTTGEIMDKHNEIIKDAKRASGIMAGITDEKVSEILREVASMLVEKTGEILAANAKDLAGLDKSDPDYDRLLLNEKRVADISSDMVAVSRLDAPYGHVLSETTRPNGMTIRKVTVPFGVIGVIYEARPNVTADVYSLCFKAGSACVLKCGHEAWHSSNTIVDIIHSVLAKHGLPEGLCTLMPADRESATAMMNAVGLIDVIIPRGGRGLIDFVRNNSKVPVIETGAGVCHTYVSASADSDMSRAVVTNAKTRRVSVCNALDCVIVHESRLDDLADICRDVADKNVVVYADERSYKALEGKYPESLLRRADNESYGTEFRDYKMAIKTVDSTEEALEHIAVFGSHHSECIMSGDEEEIAEFQNRVDAACVYANVSTAFTDGGQFGFGAEIGISTQKLHARGPMALPELTTYKYLISGSGQTRS